MGSGLRRGSATTIRSYGGVAPNRRLDDVSPAPTDFTATRSRSGGLALTTWSCVGRPRPGEVRVVRCRTALAPGDRHVARGCLTGCRSMIIDELGGVRVS